MLQVNFQFLYGMAVGILIADKETCEAMEISWGFNLLLGPISLVFSYFEEE